MGGNANVTDLVKSGAVQVHDLVQKGAISDNFHIHDIIQKGALCVHDLMQTGAVMLKGIESNAVRVKNTIIVDMGGLSVVVIAIICILACALVAMSSILALAPPESP